MCEIPSNVILAEEFARRFDGFSIGSNDLTQLMLGVDRDSADLARAVRRAQPGRQDADRGGHRAGPCGGPQDRHLRPGAERLSGVRPVPRRAGHRLDLAEPGQLRGRGARGRAGRAGAGPGPARTRGNQARLSNSGAPGHSMACSGGKPGDRSGAFLGASAITQSTVRMRLAMEPAFCRARRVTLAGSMTPISTMSPYSRRAAS